MLSKCAGGRRGDVWERFREILCGARAIHDRCNTAGAPHVGEQGQGSKLLKFPFFLHCSETVCMFLYLGTKMLSLQAHTNTYVAERGGSDRVRF